MTPVMKQQEVLQKMLRETSLHKRTLRLKEKERKSKMEWMKMKAFQRHKAPVSLQSATGSLRGNGLIGNISKELDGTESLEMKLGALAVMMEERLGFVSRKEKIIRMLK